MMQRMEVDMIRQQEDAAHGSPLHRAFSHALARLLP